MPAVQQMLLASVRGSSSTIDRTLGTNIGDMSSNGGLAAAFNGTVSQSAATSAASIVNQANNNGYVGKTFAADTALDFIDVSGSNDAGYIGSFNTTVVINAYGKTTAGAPSNATNGTLIGTITFTDTANESSLRRIDISDKTTVYKSAWVHVTQVNNAPVYVGELQFNGWQ